MSAKGENAESVIAKMLLLYVEKFRDHSENAVQLMAASFLLLYNPALAVEILERISGNENKESFIAIILLQNVKGGNL